MEQIMSESNSTHISLATKRACKRHGKRCIDELRLPHGSQAAHDGYTTVCSRAQRAVRRPAPAPPAGASRHVIRARPAATPHNSQHAAGPRFGFASRPGRLSSPPRGVRMGRFSRSHYTPY